MHIPSFDIPRLRQQSPFFTHALISLAALYLSKEEAAKESNLEPAALSEWHAVMAREYARRTADLPSSKPIYPDLPPYTFQGSDQPSQSGQSKRISYYLNESYCPMHHTKLGSLQASPFAKHRH